MNIQCDRCKKIYPDSEDTIVSNKDSPIEYHLCGYCGLILRDFIEGNIELKTIGKHEQGQNYYNKVMDDYFDSIDDNMQLIE